MIYNVKSLVLSVLCLAPLAASAATTATLNVSGTVPVIRYIGWGSTPESTSNATLDVSGPGLTQAGTQQFKVDKNLMEVTNDPFNNYTVTVTSVNGGKLKHASIASSTISYSLIVAGAALTGNIATGATYTVNTSAFTGLTTVGREVAVSVTGNPLAVAGVYNDTVRFEITPP